MEMRIEKYCTFFNGKPAAAKGTFTQRLYCSSGLVAHLSWARLLANRFRDLAEIPAPTHQNPDGHRDFTPKDEDASGYETYHNPDTHGNEN